MDLYQVLSYKIYIEHKIEENKHVKGYRTLLADAAGCGRSFLSQALNSEIQLTTDHGANLCEFWQLNENQTDYFLDLMAYERAASKTLKNRLKKKLEFYREQSRRLVSRQSNQELDLSTSLKEVIYYSSWHYAAIHTLTAIPYYQTIGAIAKRLDLPSSLVERTLQDLESLQLVAQICGLWQVKGASIFLKKNSPLSSINQNNWRLQAMKHLGKYPDDGIHISGLYAISKEDGKRMFEQFMESFKISNERANDSKEEELFCLNIDFFSV